MPSNDGSPGLPSAGKRAASARSGMGPNSASYGARYLSNRKWAILRRDELISTPPSGGPSAWLHIESLRPSKNIHGVGESAAFTLVGAARPVHPAPRLVQPSER